jgi:hypothetical protein
MAEETKATEPRVWSDDDMDAIYDKGRADGARTVWDLIAALVFLIVVLRLCRKQA